MNEKIKLSIVIPLYNDKEHIVPCIQSLKKITEKISCEIIVVDNNSTDGGILSVEEFFPSVKIIKNSENFYFAKANNQGFNIASGEYVATLNSDTEIVEDPFIPMIEYMEKHPDTGIISCPLYFPDGKLQGTRRKFKDIPAFLAEFTPFYIFLKIKFLRNYLKNLYYESNTGLPSAPVDTQVIQGALMLFKKDFLDKLGGFDETFRLSFTDDEICIRTAKLGCKIIFLPYGHVIHYESISMNRVSMVEFVHWIDYFHYIRKYLGRWPALLLLYPLYLSGRILRWILIKLGIINNIRTKKLELMED
ncbi:MAG: glycosyltransferase family 2 protein [Candidatus Eremiobacterota bacterium]